MRELGTLARSKKTKRGVEVKSLQGLPATRFQKTQWLILLEKKRAQVFCLQNEKNLGLIKTFSEADFHEMVSKRLRGSAGRTQESYGIRNSP